MNPLSDESKKRLTEFLGECWHELGSDDHMCIKCQKYLQGLWLRNPQGEAEFRINKRQFRSFSPNDWQSLGDLKDKLVEKGRWEKFEDYAFNIFSEMLYVGVPEAMHTTPTQWLLNAPRFCKLVGEFLKEARS